MLFKSTTVVAAALAPLALGLPTAAPPPVGGINATDSSPAPEYRAFTDFDYQSLNLALNQELIELDLFHYGLSRFSAEEFAEYGINAEDQFLIEFMADQEVGHAELISNILQGSGAKTCTYQYDFNTVQEFINFCVILTRFGESGVYGFLNQLNSRAAAQLLLQSIATEARQQMVFRQLAGAFPMPVWFETGITQDMAWTLLSPYIVSCPAENPRIEWNIFPTLNILNNPNLTDASIPAALSTNRTAFTSVNETLQLTFDAPGANVSYNSSYQTAVGANVTTLVPSYCAFISQLNTTYSNFTASSNSSGSCTIPGGFVYSDDPIVNGTMFVMLTQADPYVTPYNISALNDVIIAGPAVLIAG